MGIIQQKQIRQYKKHECVVFRKTKEKFGGLSNMAAGYPIIVNDIEIRTSEAIYQACRFPYSKEIQKIIIDQKSPMTAKMKSKSYRQETRSDWDSVKIDIMRWCLRLKLACNYENFSKLLGETDNKPIVEESHKDRFWGAVIDQNEVLSGMNVLGRLLMELRGIICSVSEKEMQLVSPPPISNFLLYENKIHSSDYSSKEIKSKLKATLKMKPSKQLDLPFAWPK